MTVHSPTSSEASCEESRNPTASSEPRKMTSPISASLETDSEGSPQQTNSRSHLRPQSEVSDARNSPPCPTPVSDVASPLVRSRPPMTSPMFSCQLVGQARMDMSHITMSRPITVAADHYASLYRHCLHDSGLCGATLGHYSLGRGEIMP
jgi:hypothetical protein